MKSVLDVPVALYPGGDKLPPEPQRVNLLWWLTTNEYKEEVETIQGTPSDSKQRTALLQKLPSVHPYPSGLIYLEVTPTPGHSVEELQALPYVAYVGRSVQGGYGVIVTVAALEHFTLVQFELSYLGFVPPPGCPMHTTMLCDATYDPTAYFNHQAQPYLPTKQITALVSALLRGRGERD